jgi:hypothetical protein
LYYSIVEWDKKVPPDPSLRGIFKAGTAFQNIVRDWFNSDVGPRMNPKMILIDAMGSVNDKLLGDHNISGVPDFVLCIQGERRNTPVCIVDLKTCSMNAFTTYTTLDAMKRHTWSSLYPAQVQLYNFADNYPVGALLFVSKNNPFHDWRFIEVPVDFGYIENILKKCERVNQAVVDKAVPKKLNQPFWCKGCHFESFCLPELEVTGQGVLINESEEIESIVSRIMDLKPLKKEHDDLLASIKGKLVKGRDVITKSAIIQWRKQTVNMPAKAAYSFEKHYPTFTEAKPD